jgi:endonuclease YncB( thermonuclease family)
VYSRRLTASRTCKVLAEGLRSAISAANAIVMKKLIAALALFFGAPAAAQTIAGSADVVDGDSLTVAGVSVRLLGIDAPEVGQGCQRNGSDWACGREAATQLATLIGGRTVRCEPHDTDQYGRTVATCFAGSLDLAGTMAEAGWAVALPEFSDAYVADQNRAIEQRRGIWSSEFQTPAQWRATRRSSAEPQLRASQPTQQSRQPSAPDRGCIIKGNRNRRGEWIYHLPGMPYYDQTRPEEWFCTEAQAQAAGYRRAVVR